jgi:hypothetical protein
MQLGLRAILLVAAIILFIVAAISNDDTAKDVLAIGLACVAGAFLVDDLGLSGTGGRMSGGRRDGV